MGKYLGSFSLLDLLPQA